MNTPPLLNLLGAFWDLGAPGVAIAWDVKGASVAFALGDGQLAVADARWLRGPRLESKEGGGVGLVAAEVPASRPLRVNCHEGSVLALAADTRGGFLSAGDDGRVVQVPRTGDPSILLHRPGEWITALVCSSTGLRAYASGRKVYRLALMGTQELDLPAPATALVFSPDGLVLAISHSGGVTLWAEHGEPQLLAWPGYHRALAWSPDGRYLVTAMQENALHGWRVADAGDIEMGGYPGQPLSLSFAHDGRYLATSGSTRPVCWGFDPPRANDQPSECGRASKLPVNVVSCHPRQSLVATGYVNGAVLLCRPGSDESLFVKGSGGGAVNALAWSGDGSRLAFATQDGVLGWLSLPDALFRSTQAQRGSKELTS